MGNSGTKSKPIDGNQSSDPSPQSNTLPHQSNLNNVVPQEKVEAVVQPKTSPKSVRKFDPEPVAVVQETIVTQERPKSPPQQKPSQAQVPQVVEPIRSVSPVIVAPNKPAVEEFVEQNSLDGVEDFDANSVETFPMRDSVEMFETSSMYQDRESDLALDQQSLQDFNDSMYDEQNNPLNTSLDGQSDDKNSFSTSHLSSELLLKRQTEENLAMEALRDLCSPTVCYSLQSDQWAHRKEGLELIQKYIERNTSQVKTMVEIQCNKEFVLFCIILRKYFNDRVAPVFYAAYDCFRALLKVYSSFVHGQEIEVMLKSLILPLLQNMGSECSGTNKRTQKEACRCILRIARLTSIDGLTLILTLFQTSSEDSSNHQPIISTPIQQQSTPQFTQSISSTTQQQQQTSFIQIKQKLMLLKILINEFSISESSNGNCGSGISSDLVLNVCQVGLNHSDDKIRKLSIDIIALAYLKVGKNIKMYMTDIKPVMLKVLEKKFDEIDSQNNNNNSGEDSNSKSLKKKSSASFSSSFNSSSNNLNASGGLKSENIRNLAPVVIKNGNSLHASSSRSKLLNSSFNSSFNGTAMSSMNTEGNEGEENFVVMKSNKKDRDMPSNPALSTSTPTTDKKNVSNSNVNKENENNATSFTPNKSLSSRLNSNMNNNMNNNNSKSNSSNSRFEIVDNVESYSNSPLAPHHSSNQPSRKDKKGGVSSVTKNQQKEMKSQSSYEDNRFFIDETQY